MKEGIKYTKMVSQRNYLEKLLAKGEATPEVISLARRKVHQIPDKERRYKKEEKIIMKNRIEEKKSQIKKQKINWTKTSVEVEKDLGNEARAQYRIIKKNELNRVWEIENAHKRKKLRNLVPDVPDIYQGVLLQSSLLEEKFGNP